MSFFHIPASFMCLCSRVIGDPSEVVSIFQTVGLMSSIMMDCPYGGIEVQVQKILEY